MKTTKKQLTKVTAYKCPKGTLETDPIRAYAWKLNDLATDGRDESVSFGAALWILKNKEVVVEIFKELEDEQ